MRIALISLLTLSTAVACSDTERPLVTAPESLTLDVDELSFGAVFVGGHFIKRVTMKNGGATPANVNATELPPGYSVRPSEFSLAPQETRTLEVVFAPLELGPSSGVIVFRPAIGSATAKLAVDATGAPRAITIDELIDFGELPIGETKTLSVSIRSETDGPLDIQVELGGSDAFVRVRERIDLPPRGEARLELSFAPKLRGSQQGLLTLLLCQGCPRTQVELRGTAQGLSLRASSSPLYFGSVAPGLIRTASVAIVNDGDLPVELAPPELVPDLEDGAFELVGADGFPGRLEVGESASLDLSFAPAALGTRGGRLILRDLQGGEILGVPIDAKGGGPLLELSSTNLDFGARPVGLGLSVTIILANVLEPGTVELVAAGIAGPGAASFVVRTPTLPFGVGALPASLEVHFLPIESGVLPAELVLETNHPEQPFLRIDLVGEGLGPTHCELGLYPMELRFGLVNERGSDRRDLEIHNLGSEPCPLWNFTLGGPDADLFQLAPPPADPLLLAPGQSLRLVVDRFRRPPVADQRLDASVSFHHSRVTTPAQEIAISALPITTVQLVPSPTSLIFEATPVDRASVIVLTLGPLAPSQRPNILGIGLAADSSEAFRLRPDDLAPGSLNAPRQVRVIFAPGALGPYAGEIEIRLAGHDEPLRLPLRGAGVPLCDQGDCGWPTPSCGPIEVDAGAPLPLSASGFSACSWRITQGASASRLVSGRVTSCESTFEPWLVGDYEFESLLEWENGRAAICRSPVHANPPPGLWVESVSTNEGSASPRLEILHSAIGDPHMKMAWMLACSATGGSLWPSICEWDLPGVEDNPEGVATRFDGPSLMGIESPSLSQPYYLGVQRSSTGLSPEQVSVRLYCGGALVEEDLLSFDEPQQFQFWGSVDFDSPSDCNFVEDGTRWSPHRFCLPEDPFCPPP